MNAGAWWWVLGTAAVVGVLWLWSATSRQRHTDAMIGAPDSDWAGHEGGDFTPPQRGDGNSEQGW